MARRFSFAILTLERNIGMSYPSSRKCSEARKSQAMIITIIIIMPTSIEDAAGDQRDAKSLSSRRRLSRIWFQDASVDASSPMLVAVTRVRR